jgi:hypothetical protein
MLRAGWVLALAAAAEPFPAVLGAAVEPPRGQHAKAPGSAAPSGIELFAAMPGECAPLAAPVAGPPPFFAGEILQYDVDVVGVRAGRMSLEVLPNAGRGQDLSVRARAESNTFFDKVRKVKAEIVSSLRSKDLRPGAFREDLSEGGINRIAKVTFPAGPVKGARYVEVEVRTSAGVSLSRHEVAGDAVDYVGGMYLFRALPLKIGESFCFETYALKRIWRVVGKVEGREQVSTPAGEFSTFHLKGVATRSGSGPLSTREVHLWITDDARRIPVAAVGVIDLGAVRATLYGAQRPDFHLGPPGKPLEW